MRFLSLCVFIGVTLSVSGCGDDGPKTYSVKGKVTLTDGTSVKGGYVRLYPDGGNKTPHEPIGYIVNGEFTVKTGTKDGAPLGSYKVTIAGGETGEGSDPYKTTWFSDVKYQSLETSKLKLEVVEQAEPGRYDFKLDPHPLYKKNAAPTPPPADTKEKEKDSKTTPEKK